MAQESAAPELATADHGGKHTGKISLLGPILCWAVVFADIGTSIYYVPGILYQTVQSLAGFFVFLTMFVFVLLTLKYAEVTHRFPQGGGVVTVAAQALNPWFGALGGMFILVDYFLTAAISCLSGMLYFSVVVPILGPYALWITIGVLLLLGLLNWVGISESAKVSLVGAIIAFVSDIAILVTVFTHISFSEFLSLFPAMFAGHTLTTYSLLAGFAGSFLAFSGLESISQLSPVMKQPHKKVAGIALFLVVLTVGLTSPLLTMFSTILLPGAAQNDVQSAQIISLLAGKFGGPILQTEVAISASALLIFASNTAIIGAYHVFMALSRMDFLPSFILKRNKLRGTPHFSIALATGIPIIILVVVFGNINILGDMYAFGLLGAFTLTCLGLDIVRYREWRIARTLRTRTVGSSPTNNTTGQDRLNGHPENTSATVHDFVPANVSASVTAINNLTGTSPLQDEDIKETRGLWFKIDFFLGVLTTLLVMLAWSTNLVTKPLATAFGGGVAALGMAVAYANYVYQEKKGKVPVYVTVSRIEEPLPGSTMAVLMAGNPHNDAVIRAAVNSTEPETPIEFLFISERRPRVTPPRVLEIIDPYGDDQEAKDIFARAESLALNAKLSPRKYIYLQAEPEIVSQAWQFIHPHDTVVTAQDTERFKDINPDRIRYELTPEGKVAHLLKRW